MTPQAIAASTIINGVTTAYTVNNMNQYTSVGGVAYTYDADGNLTSDGTNTYTYGPNRPIGRASPAERSPAPFGF